MSRFVKWVTLTPEERQQVAPTRQSRMTDPQGGGSPIQEQTCPVTLPNGQPCLVAYKRFQARAHRFSFPAPVRQQLWVNRGLANRAEALQEQAQALAAEAFRLAQQEEQQEARRRTPPPGRRLAPSSVLAMKAKHAQAQAGQYAVCVQFTSGLLMTIGPLYEDPDQATQELAQGQYAHTQLHGGQKLVIGLCCRWERRWVAAQFVVYPAVESAPATPQEAPGAATAEALPDRDDSPAGETALPSSPAKPPREARRKVSTPPRTEGEG